MKTANEYSMKFIRILWLWTILVLCAPDNGLAEPTWIRDSENAAKAWTVSEKADWIVLFHTEEISFSINERAEKHVRKVIKMLKPTTSHLNMPIDGTSPFHKIKDFRGWVVSPDGSSKKLTKKDIVEISSKVAAGFYDDNHIFMARFPGIRSGSVVAFEYDVIKTGWTSYHQIASIQEQQPVFYSNIALTIPKGWQLHRLEWPDSQLEFKCTNTHFNWTANRLTYQPEEPLIPSPDYLRRYILLSCYDPSSKSESVQFSDWLSFAKWSAKMLHARPDETVASQAKQLTSGLSTIEEKLDAISAFVRDEIRYVAVEIGKGRWQPRMPSQTLHNRYGDCKDKVALMRGMLETLGIHSAAALVNIGPFADLKKDLPFPMQFNHVIIAIPANTLSHAPKMPNAISMEWLFFDPTHESLPLGQLPYALQGNTVMLAIDKGTLAHSFTL